MKVTIKKSSESKGMIMKTIQHVLSLWVDLTRAEKETITSSGLTALLLEVEEDVNNEYNSVLLLHFMHNSGPRQITFGNAFSAHAAGETFKEEITTIANAIKSYQNGDITKEESFEL